MVQNILVANQTNYDQDWAASSLIQILRRGEKAVILPLEYDEGWAVDAMEFQERFASGSDFHYDVERPLRAYGIRDIQWMDFHGALKSESCSDADILCIVGTDPDQCMERIHDLGLEDMLSSFHGLLILLSESAHILEQEYESESGYDRLMMEGLGILSGVHFLMHYDESEEQIRKMIRMLETDGKPLFVLSKKSGVLIADGHIDLLGDAFIAEENDLDELYSLL